MQTFTVVLILFVGSTIGPGLCQDDTSSAEDIALYPFRVKGKWGVMDKNGQVLISCDHNYRQILGKQPVPRYSEGIAHDLWNELKNSQYFVSANSNILQPTYFKITKTLIPRRSGYILLSFEVSDINKAESQGLYVL